MLHGRYFPELVEVMSPLTLLVLVAGALLLVLAGRLALPRLVRPWALRATVIAAALALLWEGAVRGGLVEGTLLPPPTVILSNLGLMWSVGYLQPHIIASVGRLVLAAALAVVTAIPLGILVGRFQPVSDYLEPFLHMVRMAPAPAWLPLSILWFGLGNASTVFLIWLGAFFPIFLNTLAAARRADPTQVEAVLNMGGDVFDVSWEVLIPSSLPLIVTGIREGIGIGWILLLTAELVSTSIAGGLGYMMEDARSLLDAPTVLSGMLVIGVLGTSLDALMRHVERRYVRRLVA
jgi:ABC-type nitrate/sulfonate/bicarbonate transport system permease component